MEATVPRGSWTHTTSLLGAQRVAQGPFLQNDMGTGAWPALTPEVGTATSGHPDRDGTQRQAAGERGIPWAGRVCSRYNVIILNIYLVVRLFYFFSCKRKEEKDEFLICKLISLITSN